MNKPDIDTSLPHYEVRVALACLKDAGPTASHKIAELLHWPADNWSSDLNAVARQLNHLGWWWHLSHIQAVVIPTRDASGPLAGLMSNASRYDREGRPIEYVEHFAEDRPALSLCKAAIKAVYDLPLAFYVDGSHSQDVISKEPRSTEYMMAHYRAREHSRQEAIAAWNEKNNSAALEKS